MIMGLGNANALQFQDQASGSGDILAGFSSAADFTSYGTNQSHLGLATPTLNTPTTSAGGGLTSGQQYFYVITATNAQGETTASTSVSATPAGANLTDNLSWTQVPGATGYKIYRNTSNSFGSGSLLLFTIASGTTVSSIDTGAVTTAGLPPTAPTGTGLIVQGWSSQAGNLISAQDINGVTTSKFDGSGNYNTNGTQTTAGAEKQYFKENKKKI